MPGRLARPVDLLFLTGALIPLLYWPGMNIAELLGADVAPWLAASQITASWTSFFGWSLSQFVLEPRKKKPGAPKLEAVMGTLFAVLAAGAWTVGGQIAGSLAGAVIILLAPLF